MTLDLDSDGDPEYFAQVKTDYRDSGMFSCIIGYHMVPGKIQPFYTELNGGVGSEEDYADATFIEAVDITGDRVPELVLEYNGYEWGWYRIFEYRKGKLVQVFNGGGWGC